MDYQDARNVFDRMDYKVEYDAKMTTAFHMDKKCQIVRDQINQVKVLHLKLQYAMVSCRCR